MRDASTDDVLFFDVLAKSSSLTEAAREIGTSVSSVSKRLSRIEKRLGVSLMLRTTRRLTLTSEGERYAGGSAAIAAELTELEDSLSEQAELVGRIRIHASVGLGRAHIAPLVAEFCDHHPRVQIELELSPLPLNIADSTFDSHRARRLGFYRRTGRSGHRSREILARGPRCAARRRPVNRDPVPVGMGTNLSERHGTTHQHQRGIWSVTEKGRQVTEADIKPLHAEFAAENRKRSKAKKPTSKPNIDGQIDQIEAEVEADWKDTPGNTARDVAASVRAFGTTAARRIGVLQRSVYGPDRRWRNRRPWRVPDFAPELSCVLPVQAALRERDPITPSTPPSSQRAKLRCGRTLSHRLDQRLG